ncbi:TetR family transcriptional regulator [Nonomuraea glycinis]|uniref:TetR family transcriptional regulator n=1 Tax=Nonomuraea glycinis TaxID=2047744 RepID=A0A918E3B6_9ACTN|nr:TetR family transcriptional regulator [Nonomuraea glycinis]MCA2176589.1 TetR family transcriptional regulator [Nonomuraea glycinis]WSG70122.1 TetR family transcriptional regulator [Nonomuraea glycinis]GGP03701.1 TetR family transcriptional regulator [Nonomuraea glycinis]
MTVKRRPGRRPGSADTRGEILSAARKVFAEKGFDKATVRGIAREAQVDPALVHHYFDTKDRMFTEAMRLPVTPELVIPTLLDGPREELGRRLVTMILTVTAEAETREPMIALIRSAMTNEQAAQMFKEFVTRALLSRVAEELGVPHLRIEAAFAQMFGVLMARYVLRLEPMASADPEELIDLLAPTIQRYFVE